MNDDYDDDCDDNDDDDGGGVIDGDIGDNREYSGSGKSHAPWPHKVSCRVVCACTYQFAVKGEENYGQNTRQVACACEVAVEKCQTKRKLQKKKL